MFAHLFTIATTAWLIYMLYIIKTDFDISNDMAFALYILLKRCSKHMSSITRYYYYFSLHFFSISETIHAYFNVASGESLKCLCIGRLVHTCIQSFSYSVSNFIKSNRFFFPLNSNASENIYVSVDISQRMFLSVVNWTMYQLRPDNSMNWNIYENKVNSTK